MGRFMGRLARAATVLARALVGHRTIGREDTGWVTVWAAILVAVSLLGFLVPRVVAWPIAFLVFWLAVAALIRIGGSEDPPNTPSRRDAPVD
jgi:cardiolipin synthase